MSSFRCHRVLWLATISICIVNQFIGVMLTEKGLIIIDDLDGQFLGPGKPKSHDRRKTRAKELFHRQQNYSNASTNYAKGPTEILHVFQYGKNVTTATSNILCVSLFLHIQLHHPHLLRSTICNNADRIIKGERRVDYFLQRDDTPQAVKSQITQESSDQLPPPQNTTVLFTTASSEEIAAQTRALLQSKGYNVGIIEVVTPSSRKMWIRDTVKRYAAFFDLSSDQISRMTNYFELWEPLNE
jgi:DNA-dependent RNA polymerase auxiliary subunit epsilon